MSAPSSAARGGGERKGPTFERLWLGVRVARRQDCAYSRYYCCGLARSRKTMAIKKLPKHVKDVSQVEIVRPQRAKLTADEALKRMQAFARERKEQFIAAVRKGKN